MLNEIVRMTVDALTHSTEGVNAQLSSLPLDAGDSQPPDVMRIMDETADDEVVRRETVPDWPVLQVFGEGVAEMEGQASQDHHDADAASVAILYVTDDADSAEAVEEANYTQRAIYRALESLMGRAADRKRNKIQLTRLARRGYEATRMEIGEGTTTAFVTAFMRVVWQVRDLGAKD